MSRPAYLAVLLAVAFVTGASSYFGGWAVQVAGCRRLQQPGAYLAYCENPLYGSYEHEAYAFATEPEAVRAMQQAQVVFLGNSRLMFAFSTPATQAFFEQRQLSYHLLGFGYGESSAFVKEVWRRHHPTPKVIIVNADPFFRAAMSAQADTVLHHPKSAYVDALTKRVFGMAHPLLCRIPGLCSEAYPATYRDRQTGQWLWHDVLMPRGRTGASVLDAKPNSEPRSELPGWERAAGPVLDTFGLPRACVILTGVPNPQLDAEAVAATLGNRLGLPVVQPDITGLVSADDSHLSADSAERWSAAFLKDAAPLIEACLSAGNTLATGDTPQGGQSGSEPSFR